MKTVFIFEITLLFLVSFAKSELKFVFELFRHGARAPWGQLNSTVDRLNQTWAGDSELTLSGMRQHFLIGHELRNKYIINKKFLDPNYNIQQVYCISTDTNRTIMSAYSQLMGLYPPSTGPNLTDNQIENAVPPFNIDNLQELQKQLGNAALPNNSQIFPIHVFSRLDNYFNLQDPDMCKGVAPLWEKNLKKPILNEMLTKFNSQYPNLGSQVNMNFASWSDLYFFSDGFVSGYFDRRSYPQITYNLDDLYKSCLDVLREDMFEKNFGDDGEMIALNAMSPIVNRLETYFQKVISVDNTSNGENTDPKMVLYSGHDTNIAALLIYLNNALNLNFTYPYVKLASNFIIDFSRNDSSSKPYTYNDYIVDIYYNGELLYSNSYQDFHTKSSRIAISNSKTSSFCEFEVKNNDSYFLLAVVCLSIITICLVVANVVLFVRRKKARDNYLPV